jgi:hypothetical protein
MRICVIALLTNQNNDFVTVTDGGEGVCVDPGEKGAILEAGGPGPPGGGKGWQLASDSGGEET